MHEEAYVDRDHRIWMSLEGYEERLTEMSDDELFTENELDQLRKPQVEALVEIYAEHLDQQSNDELFGEEPWQKIRDAEIELQLEAERNRLESLTDEEWIAAFPDIQTIAPSNE